LDEMRLTAKESRCEAALGAGSVDRALAELGDLVSAHPLRERPHALLMRALYLAGRRGEALEAYRSLRERLRDELGLEPSPELAELHGRLLRSEISPTPPRTSRGASPAPPP